MYRVAKKQDVDNILQLSARYQNENTFERGGVKYDAVNIPPVPDLNDFQSTAYVANSSAWTRRQMNGEKNQTRNTD